MSDNLDKYIPEFDEEEARNKLAGYTREQLLDMLITSYKVRRVVEKWAEEDARKLKRIQGILCSPAMGVTQSLRRATGPIQLTAYSMRAS